MMDTHGFDIWADGYDESVNASCISNEYPFAGYREIINIIYNEVMSIKKSQVLDIGIGTGVLSKKLHDNNHVITGIDFSEKMLSISSKNMPNAKLIQHDFSKGLPGELKTEKYHFIIFTYSIHHLTDTEKIVLLNSLKSHLISNGKIFIGDVSFETSIDQANCKNEYSSIWDCDEKYYNYEDIKNHLQFSSKSYRQISFCSGIMTLSL